MAKKKSTKKTSKNTKTTPEIQPVKETKKVELADEYDFGDEIGGDAPKVAEPPAEEKVTDDPDDDKPVEVVAISDDLLTQAIKAGLSMAEARSFGTDELLTTALVAMARSAKNVKTTAQSGEKAAEATAPVADFKLDLDPDLYEPEVIKAFEGMQKHVQDQMGAMQAQHKSVLDELHTQRQQDSERRVDGMFTALGGDWQDVFGDGPTTALRQTSAHAKNRAKVIEQMNMVEAGAKALGKPVPADLFHNTVDSVFSEHVTSIADAVTGDAVDARRAQALVPPTGREGKPMSKEEATVQHVREEMVARGLEPSDDGYDYDDEQAAFPE